MSTKFIVNGQEKEVSYIINGIDISGEFIGNTAHGMGHDDEGRYIASQEDFDWWENTIAAHEQMDKVIANYKERFDPEEVYWIVQNWISDDLDDQPRQVTLGLHLELGEI
jgi:hypothetical protein